MTLAEQAIRGIKWSSASQFARQIIQFIAMVVLARLLSPADFGLVGMAAIISGFAGLFHDLGTSAAIIQKKDISEELLSSVFWGNVAFGAAITFLLFALAPAVAAFYREPRVTPVLRMLSLTFCISGFSIVQQAVLERTMRFNIIARIEIIAAAISAAVGISAALLHAGVWSLVCQMLTSALVITVLLWRAAEWRPTQRFRWQELKSVGNFSMNLTGFSIFNYFIRNADNLLIGRFLGATDLGCYALAYNIMHYPLQSISSVIGRVMFPVFSKIQDDDTKFRQAYVKLTAALALITLPMMFGLWVLARPFVLSVFGLAWERVIMLIWILAPIGAMQSIGTTVGIIYQAKGRTDWLFRWGVAAGLIIVTAFIIGLQWGIVGVATAYAIASILLIYPSFAIPFRIIRLPFRDFMVSLRYPLASSGLMVLTLLIMKTFLFDAVNSTAQLVILVPIGIAAYFLATWFLNRNQLKEIVSLAGGR